MILAGGQGSRLGALTKNIAKPAVPFGGKYRIIDFPLSNCANSGIDKVGVLTQYRPLELHNYLGTGSAWDLDKRNGGVFILPPYARDKGADWYKGTADAIYQNLNFIELMMNGAITLGTLDGANVEIRDAVGQDNCVIFGLTAPEVLGYYATGAYSAWDEYNTNAAVRRVMKGGLIYSDYITTVSRTYAQEIQYEYFGEHLDGLLRQRSDDLFGIVNGIDYDIYNPSTDENLFETYDIDTVDRKLDNKVALQKLLGLPEDRMTPMVALVSRLVPPKGLDLIVRIMDSVPLVCITGQVGNPYIGKDSFQEADICGITTPITKHNYLVKNPADLPRVLKEAFFIARTGRPGPVVVDIAKDVFAAQISYEYPKKVSLKGYSGDFTGDTKDVQTVLGALQEAKRPLFFIGGGVTLADMTEDMRAVVERTGIPVVTSLMIIPLVETLPTDRTTRQWQQVKIVGFIGFWLQNIYYGGLDWHTNCYKNYRAQGYFVKVTLPAGSYTGYSNRFFGTSQVRLVNP